MDYKFIYFLLLLLILILFYCMQRKYIETYQLQDIPCFRNYKQDYPCCGIDYKISQDMGHYNNEHRNKVCPRNKPICKNYTPWKRQPWGKCTGEEYSSLIDNTISDNDYQSIPDKGCAGYKLINGEADFFGDSNESYNSLKNKCKSTCNLSSHCGGFSIKNHGFPRPGRKCELKSFNIKNCLKGDEENSKTWIKKKKYITYDYIPINLKKKVNEIYECKDPQYPYLEEGGKKCSKIPGKKKIKKYKPFERTSILKRYTLGKNVFNPLQKMEEFAQFLDNKIVAISIAHRSSNNFARDTDNGIQFDRSNIGHKEKYKIIYAGTKNYIYIISGHRNTRCRYQRSNSKIVCDNKEQNWGLFAIYTQQTWNMNGKRFEIYLKNISESKTTGKNGICGFKRKDSRIECNRNLNNIYEKFIFIIL